MLEHFQSQIESNRKANIADDKMILHCLIENKVASHLFKLKITELSKLTDMTFIQYVPTSDMIPRFRVNEEGQLKKLRNELL